MTSWTHFRDKSAPVIRTRPAQKCKQTQTTTVKGGHFNYNLIHLPNEKVNHHLFAHSRRPDQRNEFTRDGDTQHAATQSVTLTAGGGDDGGSTAVVVC